MQANSKYTNKEASKRVGIMTSRLRGRISIGCFEPMKYTVVVTMHNPDNGFAKNQRVLRRVR